MNKLSFKKGISVVEIVIGLIILSILLIVLMNLMTTGVRGASKGITHLGLMESSSILMAQIEYDLLRAYQIDPSFIAGINARWGILTPGGSAIITYNLLTNGVERRLDEPSGSQQYVFLKDTKVDISFESFSFADTPNQTQRVAILVSLKVSSHERAQGNSEEFSLKRLIFCKNIVLSS